MAYLVVFFATIAVLEVLRRNAARFGLVSYPGAHRHHTQPTPLVGGLGIFAGIALGVWLLPVDPETRATLTMAGFVLVSMGVWDDIREASFTSRFVAQALAVGLLAFIADVSLRDLGYIFDTSQSLFLGRWGVALTIFAAVGVINAVNMSDGLDGLAGSLALVACVSLLFASYATGNLLYVPFLGLVVTTLIGFMLFNARMPGFQSARLYLGDAGSLLVGFLLAWFLIAMSQGETRVIAPVTALWIFALPLFDAVTALLRRPMQGRSPFHADRTHYHHYLRDLGLNVNQTLLVSAVVASGLASIGLISEFKGIPEHTMFYAFLALFVVYFVFMVYLDINIQRLLQQRCEARLRKAEEVRDEEPVKSAQ